MSTLEKKKYQVFISSTYTDLRVERDKVRDAILSMYHFPVGMELFGAADEEQWEIIKETIDTSDYYVLLIGQRYGSVIPDGPDSGISYTEKEFRYAKEQKIPILAFLIDDDVPVKAENVEKKYQEEFKSFKAAVKTGRTVAWWKNPDDLAQKVTAALYKQISRKSRPGWIRGDSIDVEKSLNTITNLAQRIQQLEEENRKLKESTVQRKPELSVNITNYGTREKPTNGENFNSIRLKEIEREGHMTVPRKLSADEIIGQENISSYDITEYNKSLPTKKDIEQYNDAVFAFRMMVENGHHIKCELYNNGTAKAMDVSARFEFPEELIVLKWSEVEKANPPKKPKMPINPISAKAIKNTLLPFSNFKNIAEMAHNSETQYYGDGKYEVQPKPIIPMMDYQYPWGESVDGKIAEVSARELLHKSEVLSGDFCVIPKAKGTYTIKISLMCEEYIEPDVKEIQLVVE